MSIIKTNGGHKEPPTVAHEPELASPEPELESINKLLEEELQKADETKANGTGSGGSIRSIGIDTEFQLADLFVKEHGEWTRHISLQNCWMEWTGQKWQEQKTLKVFDQIKFMLEKYSLVSRLATKKKMQSANMVSAVERIVRRNQKMIAVTLEQWDTDQWLLNTPKGILDLRTGSLTQHDPMQYMTKMANAWPDGSNCPMWKAHLNEAFEGNQELIRGLQCTLGYALTGLTTEQIFLFFYGVANAGKSTIIEVLQGVFGDYYVNSDVETFLSQKHPRHETEMARLRGARLVATPETPEGRFLNETRIKQVTGNDTISAKWMYGNFFDFKPQFLLIIYGNNKLKIQTVDDAIRRRLHVYPFNVPIFNRTPGYPERMLNEEANGIMQWLVDGCLMWQKDGRIIAPPVVREASDTYMEDEDIILRWAKDRELTVTGKSEDRFFTRTAWDDFNIWQYATNEPYKLSKREFSSRLKKNSERLGLRYTEDLNIPGIIGAGSGYKGGYLKS